MQSLLARASQYDKNDRLTQLGPQVRPLAILTFLPRPSPPADVTHGIEDEDAENDAIDGTADSIQDGETGTETLDGEEGELDDGGSTNGDDIVELSDGAVGESHGGVAPSWLLLGLSA